MGNTFVGNMKRKKTVASWAGPSSRFTAKPGLCACAVAPKHTYRSSRKSQMRGLDVVKAG